MKTLHFSLITVHCSLFTVLCSAQIAINNTSSKPDVSAILDLNTGNSGVNKGFLAPQVALTNVNAAAPVTAPATGLMVYSTSAPTGGNGAGYYYWNGSAWISLGGASSGVSGSGVNNYIARWTPDRNTLGTGLIQDNDTAVGINNAPVATQMLTVTGTYYYGIYATTQDINGTDAGVYGEDDNNYGVEGVSAYGDGIYGSSSTGYGGSFLSTFGTAVSGSGRGGGYFTASNGTGVYGSSAYGQGVYGSGTTYGGNFTASNGMGVFGSGVSFGGNFTASNGQGVYSNSSSATGDSSLGQTYGVYGVTPDVDGSYAGVYGEDDYRGNNGTGIGVWGYSKNSYGTGVYGVSNGIGIEGVGYSSNSLHLGFYGYMNTAGVLGAYCGGSNFNENGAGVIGLAGESVFVAPWNAAVLGITNDANTYAVAGQNQASGGIAFYGQGEAIGGSFIALSGIGVNGSGTSYGGSFSASSGQGVYSASSNAAGDSSIGATVGVYGEGSVGGEFSGSKYGLIVSSGSVGIGCTSPAYTLDVNGNIRATGSVLYGGGNCTANANAYSKPDYVFEPDYKKTYSTFEVEKFILEQGHLPWVTSAVDEKKENKGAVDITRMSFQTLEATECIQMQVIEQQKTIVSQQKLAVSQQAEIDQLKKQAPSVSQQTEINDLKKQNDELKKQVSVLAKSIEILLDKQK